MFGIEGVMELKVGGFGFPVGFGQGEAVYAGERGSIDVDVAVFIFESFALLPGEFGCGVVPVGGFVSFYVYADVERFVTVGADLVADEFKVLIDTLFSNPVDEEVEGASGAGDEEDCEGFDGFVGDAGYDAAEDFQVGYGIVYCGQWEDVADKGIEYGFLGFLPEGFECIRERCHGCGLDEGYGAF